MRRARCIAWRTLCTETRPAGAAGPGGASETQGGFHLEGTCPVPGARGLAEWVLEREQGEQQALNPCGGPRQGAEGLGFLRVSQRAGARAGGRLGTGQRTEKSLVPRPWGTQCPEVGKGDDLATGGAGARGGAGQNRAVAGPCRAGRAEDLPCTLQSRDGGAGRVGLRVLLAGGEERRAWAGTWLGLAGMRRGVLTLSSHLPLSRFPLGL